MPTDVDIDEPSHMPTAIADGFSAVRWKQMAFLFALFILFSSTTFVDNLLYHIPGTKKNGALSNYGTVLQATFLVMSMIVIDALVATKLI